MTISEVFSKLSAHLVEGMMIHDRMADYYDFLGLMGFKRMHEYFFLRDAAEMRGVKRYYGNHVNKLLPESAVSPPWSIPASWYGYSRSDVGADTKRTSVKNGIEKLSAWVHEGKQLYEQCYQDLCELGEIAAACKVRELVSLADMEAKHIDRLAINLKGIDYDMPTIFLMQDEIHRCYDEKTRGIGVTIC